MDTPRSRITHELKTWPEFFEQTWNGRKKFELRRNDRDFQVGDHLLLKEWDPAIEEPYGPGEGGKYKGYTGRETLMRVDYIMKAEDATFVGMGYENTSPINAGYVIMSVSHVH